MSILSYEAAKNEAAIFLNEVAANLTKANASNKGGIITDINGTLDRSSPGTGLDLFLSDCFQDGIPVKLISGRYNDFPYKITKLLGLPDSDPRHDVTGVLHHKPFSLPVMNACLLFDDEKPLHQFTVLQGGVAYDANNVKITGFLAAYESLSTEDRKAVRAPLVEAHRAKGLLQERAAAPVVDSQPPVSPS